MAKNKDKNKNFNKYPQIKFGEFRLNPASRRYVNEVLDSNWLTMGNYVNKLEKKWCNLFGYKYAKAVNSGTSALMACFLSLYEFGAKEGDEIICPALSFIATANAIRAAGFKPVFVDVELETLNINTNLIKEKISDRTVAVCAVNLMGRPCKLDELKSIVFNDWPFGINNNTKLIIDNCEGYGCKYNGKYSLEYADFEVSSHFAAHICCAGEMGLCSVNDEKLADLIDSVRSHGRPINSLYFDHQRFGLNLKTTDLHAAVGLGEFARFNQIFQKRKKHLNELIKYTEKYKEFAHFNLPDDDTYYHAPHAFNIVIKPKYISYHGIDKLKGILDNYNIQWKRTFGSMPTQHKCFEYLGYKLGDFPVAEYIGDNSIHISCGQYLTKKDLQRIKIALDEYFTPLVNQKIHDMLFTDINGNPFFSFDEDPFNLGKDRIGL